MSSDDAPVLVVGAGLAGLACAVGLKRRGIPAVVLEAGDAVGGRVRTDVVDGHRCDRGFQLLNPSYPAARRLLDLTALDVRRFGRGVEVVGAGTRAPDGVARLVDPLTRPRTLPATLRGARDLVRPGEAARLARWVAPALGPVPRLLRGEDRSLGVALDAAGIDGPLRRRVLEPFLTGTVADDPEDVSERFARLLLRSFLRATPGVPALGMQAMPEQLAARLDRPVHLGRSVGRVRRGPGGVRVGTDDGELSAPAVVVAADPATAAALLDLPAPAPRGLATWWFTAPAAPAGSSDLLRVDGDRSGPVVNTAVVSAAAPSYAPPGRTLVQATTLHPGPGREGPDEASVRRHLARLWGPEQAGWEVLVRHDVTAALPTSHAPLRHRQAVDLGGGLLVAGDHRDTASIQGALVSGTRAATAVARQREAA